MQGRLLVLAGLLCCAPAWAQAPEGALDEAEVVRRAQGYGPWARGQAARLLEAEAEVLREEAWPAPSITFLHEEIFPDQQTREETLIVSQPFDLSGRRGLRQDAARQRAQAQGFGLATERAERGGLARARFYKMMAAQRRLDAARAWEARVGEVAQVLERREAAGLSSRYEHARVAQEQERARALVEREEREVLSAWRELERLWGHSAQGPAPLAAGELSPPSPPELDALQERAARAPRVLGAQREREAAQREREAAQTWVPPMSLGLGWRRLDSQGQAGQGFALEWGVDLPWGGEREARRAQAQGADERAASDLEMLEDERGAELRRLHEALLGLRAQAQERRGALERAREFLALAQDGYARGQLDLLEVLEASRLCLEDEQALLDLELDARLRAVALDLWTLQEEP